jgi:hypothetical protein
MQDFKLMAPNETRQMRLVPENVSDRRPEHLGHGHQFHFFPHKFEQGQILLQDKQRKPMMGGVRQEGTQEGEKILGYAGSAALNYRRGNADAHG